MTCSRQIELSESNSFERRAQSSQRRQAQPKSANNNLPKNEHKFLGRKKLRKCRRWRRRKERRPKTADINQDFQQLCIVNQQTHRLSLCSGTFSFESSLTIRLLPISPPSMRSSPSAFPVFPWPSSLFHSTFSRTPCIWSVWEHKPCSRYGRSPLPLAFQIT